MIIGSFFEVKGQYKIWCRFFWRFVDICHTYDMHEEPKFLRRELLLTQIFDFFWDSNVSLCSLHHLHFGRWLHAKKNIVRKSKYSKLQFENVSKSTNSTRPQKCTFLRSKNNWTLICDEKAKKLCNCCSVRKPTSLMESVMFPLACQSLLFQSGKVAEEK